MPIFFKRAQWSKYCARLRLFHTIETVLWRVERDEVAMAFQEQPRLGAVGIDVGLVCDQADPFAGEGRVIVARQQVDPQLDRSVAVVTQSQNKPCLTIHFLFRRSPIDS